MNFNLKTCNVVPFRFCSFLVLDLSENIQNEFCHIFSFSRDEGLHFHSRFLSAFYPAFSGPIVMLRSITNVTASLQGFRTRGKSSREGFFPPRKVFAFCVLDWNNFSPNKSEQKKCTMTTAELKSEPNLFLFFQVSFLYQQLRGISGRGRPSQKNRRP